MTATVEGQLILVRGSTRTVELAILDEHGNAIALAEADRATFSVRETPSASSALFTRSTEDVPASLAIDVSASKLTFTPTGAEALAWTAGLWCGQIAIRFGGADTWVVSDPFDVRILPLGTTLP